MRFAAALVLWLFTTVALGVAVSAAWVQMNIVSEDGYAAIAQKAAGDPVLQSAVAGELTTRAMALIAEQGGHRFPVDSSQVHDAATAFTAGPSFPPLFGRLNRAAHSWLFSDPRAAGDQWVVDVAPMLDDSSIQQMLRSYNVKVPAKLTVPLTVSESQPLRQGQLKPLAAWGPWVAVGAIALSGVFGLLTLVAVRRRGKGLSSLGISALLVGAAGWAVIEVGSRYIDVVLDHTPGDIGRIADVMVGHAEGSLHLWLNLVLMGGAAMVVFGVLIALVGSLFK